MSLIEIEALVASTALFLVPLLVAAVCLVRRYRIQRRRQPVSFLEVTRGKP